MECRTDAELAFDPDAAVMLLQDAFADRKAEPAATLFARVRCIDLLEPHEHFFEHVAGNAATVVAYSDVNILKLARNFDTNNRAERREFHSIADEVHNGLYDAVGIRIDVNIEPGNFESDARAVGVRLHHF